MAKKVKNSDCFAIMVDYLSENGNIVATNLREVYSTEEGAVAFLDSIGNRDGWIVQTGPLNYHIREVNFYC